MPQFSDYTFYLNHGGKLSEDAYKSAVHDAHAEIISQTNGAALSAPLAMREAIKLCECAMVDVVSAYTEAESMLPKGISSVSNDSYSVTAKSGTAQTESQELFAICARYLQWPVNLMSRWL